MIKFLRITNSQNNGDPVNLTGFTVVFSYGWAENSLVAATVTVSDPTNGIVMVTYNLVATGNALILVDCGNANDPATGQPLASGDRFREVEFEAVILANAVHGGDAAVLQLAHLNIVASDSNSAVLIEHTTGEACAMLIETQGGGCAGIHIESAGGDGIDCYGMAGAGLEVGGSVNTGDFVLYNGVISSAGGQGHQILLNNTPFGPAAIATAVWSYLCTAADALGVTKMGGWLRSSLASITNQLSVAPVVIRRLVDQAGNLSLDTGCDYLDADGRSVQFGIPAGFTSLTGSTPTLDITLNKGGLPSPMPALTVTGTVQTGSFVINGTTYTTIVDFPITAAQTASLTNWSPNAYLYRVRAVWTSPAKVIPIVDPSTCTALW